MRPFPILAALGASAALVACGGTTEKIVTVPAAAPTVAATGAAHPAPTISPAADRRATGRAALELSDLPTGWTEPDPDAKAKPTAAAECDGASPHGPSVSSRTDVVFRKAPDRRVTHIVTIFDTEAEAADMIGDLSTAKTRGCIAAYFDDRADEQGPDGVEYDDATSAKLNVPALGDGTAAFRISINATSGQVDRTFATEAIATRIGRGVSLLEFYEVAEADEIDLAALAARRLKAAQSPE